MAFVRCLTSGCLCERLKPFNQCQISILQIGVQASRRSSKEPTVASGEDAAVSKPGILNTEDGVPSTGRYHPKEPNNMSAYSQLCVSLIAFQCLCIISLHPTPSPPSPPLLSFLYMFSKERFGSERGSGWPHLSAWCVAVHAVEKSQTTT